MRYTSKSSPLDKMATISDDISKCVLVNDFSVFWFEFHLSLFLSFNWQSASMGSGNGLAVTNDTFFPEAILIQFADEYVRH